MTKALKSLLKIVISLILVPSVLVFVHLQRTIYKAGFCFVGPTSTPISNQYDALSTTNGITTLPTFDVKQLYGIYQLNLIEGFGPGFVQIPSSHDTKTSYARIFSFLAQYGWPSAPILETDFISPISTLKSVRTETQFVFPTPKFLSKHKYDDTKWCLTAVDTIVACSETVAADENAKEYFPRSGIWSSPSSTSSPSLSIQVSCPKSTSVPYGEILRQKQHRQNRNREFILSNPATTFLLLLNCGIAYYYWNYRIPPASVCKNYSRIVHYKEVWRCFTGALAHFEVLHLGFNMVSLASYGEALEEFGYGSVPFLALNISLIAATNVVMMLITKYRIHIAASDSEIHHLKEQSAVGYSGVLFAWMVIASMEQPQTCPIIFLPDLCFESFSLYKDYLKFNIAPLVSLIVIQLILPRISFVGHLSGIICGFALHWGLLRIGFFLPHIWGPIMTVVWLWKVENVLGWKANRQDELYTLDNIALEEDENEEEESATQNQMKQAMMNFFSKRESTLGYIKSLLSFTAYTLMGISIISAMYFDVGIVVAQMISSFLFYTGSYCFIQCEGKNGDSPKVGHIFRGYIITTLVLLVTDAISLPGWWIARAFISFHRPILFPTNTIVIFTTALIRIGLNLWGFILSVKVLGGIGELSGGPFYKIVLGWLNGNARIIGDTLLAPVYRAFDGDGIALSTAGSNERAPRPADAWIGTGIQRWV